MVLRKVVFIFLILCCILVHTSAFSDIMYQMQGEIQTSPWFYEPVHQMNGISFSTMWMLGITINRFTTGLDVYSDYSSVHGIMESNLFKGAWFNLGCNLSFMYDFTSWWACKLSTGFLWNQSAFDYNNSGWLGRSLPGLELLFSSMFIITPDVHLEIVNRFDLFLSQNEFLEDAYCKLGARVHINSGFLRSMRFFLECDAVYWSYKSEIITEGLKSWMFKGQAGVAFQFGKKPAKDTYNEDIITDTIVIDEQENDHETPNQDPYLDPALEKLKNSKTGDTVIFYNILFHNEDIADESIPVLDGLAELLLENNKLVISVHGYSEFMQDPQKEFELCKIRAHKIKEYLVSKGVAETQILKHPVGNIMIDKNYYIMIDVIKSS